MRLVTHHKYFSIAVLVLAVVVAVYYIDTVMVIMLANIN